MQATQWQNKKRTGTKQICQQENPSFAKSVRFFHGSHEEIDTIRHLLAFN